MAGSAEVTAGANATAVEINLIRTDAITRKVRFYFNIEGSISAATGLQIIPVPESMTVVEIKHKCKSGSATLAVKTVSGTTIKSGMAVTTSYTSETAITNAALSENDELQIDISAPSSLVDIRVLVMCTEVI